MLDKVNLPPLGSYEIPLGSYALNGEEVLVNVNGKTYPLSGEMVMDGSITRDGIDLINKIIWQQ